MTTKADFTEEEWKQVLEGPTSAGMIVTTAESGGTFRETFAMARPTPTPARSTAPPSCSTKSSPTGRRPSGPRRTRKRS